MTEKDEKMLKDFFKSAAQQIIEDNGFTERVMNRLPSAVSLQEQVSMAAPQRKRASLSRELWLSRLWTVLCVALGLVMFFAMNGWNTVKTSIEVLIQTLPTQVNPLSVAFCLLATFALVIVMTMQRERVYQ